ncbi:MAG: response regulator transcription factor [Patescibacteria group bacterium]|nr:response regulator transcription factor [Patescibacteria group bacterium]
MRILIVEDDETTAQNVKKLLELKGMAVDWIPTAEKARTRVLLYRNEYDIIVLDLTLPGGMDGMTLTRELRGEGISTPIIILTGRSETKSKVELLNSGADDYVVKPFSSEELIARISSVLRRPVTTEPVVYELGELTIDTSAHRLRSGDAEISLTLKEYALFECFLRRPNEVLKREDLYNQVWDFNSLMWSNVLDVHMKNLRKKLAVAGDSARFETIRGVGYRLIA